MSMTRRQYFIRLVLRIVVLIACGLTLTFFPSAFGVIEGMRFFSELSPLHALWCVWMLDMILQLVPVGREFYISIGSQKLFATHFRPIREKITRHALSEYVLSTTRAAYRVMLLWIGLIAVIAGLYFSGVICRTGLFMISVAFYVCDLICVLIWCPFRLIMNNKCCTTCRIFNWDHLMMFSPLVFAGGFMCLSLFVMSVVNWTVWELGVYFHPERFCERTNAALRCSECTDKLCTQYCQKLRKKQNAK